ncbi:MAG: hypothetical protein AABZ31_14220 [Bdellovibrionota bacterium]
MIRPSKLAFFKVQLALTFSVGLAMCTIVSSQAHADESVGRIKVEEVLLRPTYFSQEKEGGEFSFEDSSISVEWQKDQNFSARLMIGSTLERSVNQIYLETEPDDALGFIEAYAQYTGIYGRVRAGLLPLNFGLAGMSEDYERIWPYSLLIEDRIIGLRDYGVSYYTSNNRFYTELVVHNGEVDTKPNDGNPWLTTRWGWKNEKFQLQVTGQTGRTNKDTTTLGSPTIGGWDRTKNAQWRFVALSLQWRLRKWEVNFQATSGEAQQREDEKTLALYQFDFIRYLGPNWGVGLRHDQYDPNTKAKDDRVSEESAIVFTKSDDATSLVSLVFTKVLEEQYQEPNDKLWLQWRLTPFVK